MDADLQHVAGDLVRGDDFVVGHEHERGVRRTPPFDAIEGLKYDSRKLLRITPSSILPLSRMRVVNRAEKNSSISTPYFTAPAGSSRETPRCSGSAPP